MDDNDESKTDDLQTLFKYRLPSAQVQRLRELGWLLILFVGLGFGFGLFSALEFWTCTIKNPDITFIQCIRHDNLSKRSKE